MSEPKFIQVHSLHAYTAALLNRDDTGLAKRLPFGGAMRTRISSQCLKRHWRQADSRHALREIEGAERAIRSREVVTKEVIGKLRADGAFSAEVLDKIEPEFQKAVYGDKAAVAKSRQPLLIGYPEIEYLRTQAQSIAQKSGGDAAAAAKLAGTFCEDAKKNFLAMREQTALPGGIEGALFGRMVTSDPAANIDAPVHVAHAFTVHEEESESDYFTTVDDLRDADEDAGADHIGNVELTSGLYYGYVVIDVPGLVSNLSGKSASDWLNADTDRQMAGQVVEHLLHLIATVSPGAKRGSTAPYGYAQLMLVEIGDRQPRSLANAFRKPAGATLHAASVQLAAHLKALDDAYGTDEARQMLSLEDEPKLPGTTRASLPELASWVASRVRDGSMAT